MSNDEITKKNQTGKHFKVKKNSKKKNKNQIWLEKKLKEDKIRKKKLKTISNKINRK